MQIIGIPLFLHKIIIFIIFNLNLILN